MSSQSSVPPSNCSDAVIPFDDPIVAEVRRVRKEILDEYGGDFEAMMRDMMKKQFEQGHNVLRAQPRTPAPESTGPESRES